MAKKGGAPENLDPVRTKEEAKKRGRNGGIKSGEARRNKRDAKNAMNLLLNMAAKGQLKENLEHLGIGSEDQTNMVALQARLFTMALGGNLQAYDRVIKISGNDPEENRKERESLASDKRRDRETDARVTAMERGDSMGHYAMPGDDQFDDEETEDVVIYMPYTERDAKPEAEDPVVHASETGTVSEVADSGTAPAIGSDTAPQASVEGGGAE